MSSRIAQSLLLSLAALPTLAADDAGCASFTDMYGASAIDCECGDALKRRDIQSPLAGLVPTAVCEFSESTYESGLAQIHGKFFFGGRHVFHGTLRFYASEVLADTLDFQGAVLAPILPIHVSMNHFRFARQEEALKALAIPEAPHANFCWEASATVVVNEMLALPGGTDESGAYALIYTIEPGATFSACRTSP